MGGQYTRCALPVYVSGHAALELEEVVEFRDDEEKAQLLVGAPQAHRPLHGGPRWGRPLPPATPVPTAQPARGQAFAKRRVSGRPRRVVAERAVRRILQGRNTRPASALTAPPSSGIPYLKRDTPTFNHMAKTIEPKELTEVSEAQIAVHWKEEESYPPSEKFKAQANMRDPHILEKFGLDKFPDCFKEYADMLTWFEPYHTVLDTSDAPFWKWFVGGKINASYNCVDRNLAKYGTKAAFIFVPEPEAERDVVIKYQELYDRVNEVAALLRGLGLKAGDRVTFHMPMVPELPITMLACARLGIIHSQVFGGVSGQACGSRIQDSGSRVLITLDSYWRNGSLLDSKAKAHITGK